MTAIAAAYVRYGNLPALLAVLAGVKPVMIAIIAQALWRLGRTVLTNAWLGVLAAGATVAAIFGAHELLVLLGAALISVAASMTIRGGGAPLVASVGTPVVETTSATVLGRVEGLGDLSHASAVFGRDGRHAYVFGRDGGLSKIDLLERSLTEHGCEAFVPRDTPPAAKG